MNIKIDKKDDIVLKILHYFITEEDYKPVIINGLDNEIWLENMEKDLKLIRINNNYIHNEEQLKVDTFKAKNIMNSIKKTTFSINMNMLNLLLDVREDVKVTESKNMETVIVDKINDFKKNKVVEEFFPKVKNSVLSDKMDPIEFFKLTEDMNLKTIKNEKKLAKIFSPKKPTVTYSLIVINVVIFMLLRVLDSDGSLFNLFVNFKPLVKSGQIYRLVTSMFLHYDVIHLLFNMVALYNLGPQVERYYGKKRFILIYFISGILASIFSCVFMNNNTTSAGASGAIFALFGCIIYFSYYYRATIQGVLRSQIMPTLVINMLLPIFIPGIGVAAHIGGFIGGLLMAMAIGIGDKSRKNDEINGVVVLIAIFVFMIYMLMR